ncbi:unnamed protein product, partial [Mesorhabditis belari]|uniref:Receptor ligand binding region domain-containing protein n=1 Tax=Mesorhabditis belari TaxID=2138241 RepID=A0AAF3F6M4_9BILA
MRTTFTARRPPKKALLLSAWLALAWCTLFTTVCAAEYDEYETTIEYRERIRRHYTSPRYTREIEEAPTEVIDFHQRLRTPKSVLDPERPIDVPPKLVTEDHPIYMVIPLPSTDDISAGRNPFRLSIPLVEPIVDLAVESVYKQQLVQRNSIRVIYKDSQMSDAHGPNVAIDMLVQNKLDVIIGYAYVYALAPVARMAPFWRDIDSNGIPEYSMMTRINSPYKNFRQSVEKLWDAYNWTTTVFIYHDRRFGSGSLATGW